MPGAFAISAQDLRNLSLRNSMTSISINSCTPSRGVSPKSEQVQLAQSGHSLKKTRRTPSARAVRRHVNDCRFGALIQVKKTPLDVRFGPIANNRGSYSTTSSARAEATKACLARVLGGLKIDRRLIFGRRLEPACRLVSRPGSMSFWSGCRTVIVGRWRPPPQRRSAVSCDVA